MRCIVLRDEKKAKVMNRLDKTNVPVNNVRNG
jgi:hypothetical protein